MKNLNIFGFREKLTAAFSLLIIFIISSLFIVISDKTETSIENNIIDITSSFIGIIDEECTVYFEKNDLHKLQQFTTRIGSNEVFIYAEMLNNKGKTITEFSSVPELLEIARQRTPFEYGLFSGNHVEYVDENVFDVVLSVHSTGSQITGFIRLGIFLPELRNSMNSQKDFYLIIFLISLVIGIFFSITLSNSLQRPIKELVNYTREIANGNLKFKFRQRSKDEFGKLSQAFQDMAARLHKSQSAIKDYQDSLEKLVARQSKNYIESEEKYRNLIQFSTDLIFIIQNQRFVFTNNKIYQFVEKGFPVHDVLIDEIPFIENENRKQLLKEMQKIPENDRKEYSFEIRGTDKFSNPRLFEFRFHRIIYQNNPAFQGLIRDITEKKNTELQLFQAQKIESVGTLAGSLAHDFNNTLGAIIPKAEIISEITRNKEIAHEANQIIKACQGASQMVRKLMSFSRKDDLIIREIDPNLIVSNVLELIGGSLKRNIEIITKFCKRKVLVNADIHRMEQAILNILINARDAMPEGGKILISSHISLNPSLIIESENLVGKAQKFYVLNISDNGTGIDETIIDKIFEPFFTTKKAGEGTGLGLSTTYRIIKSHRGELTVSSKRNVGTTFKIILPILTESTENENLDSSVSTEKNGSPGVLIVEDDHMMRETIAKLLEHQNYSSFESNNAENAFEILSKNYKQIKFAIIDIELPETDGFQLSAEIKNIHPGILVLLISGHAENERVTTAIRENQVDLFLKKPFKAEELRQSLQKLVIKQKGK